MNNVIYPDFDYHLYAVINQARDAINALREKELYKYGLSPSEASVLYLLLDNDNDMTPAEIARRTLRKSHSVHGLLGRMEKKGLITRVRDTKRKNIWRISLTDKGYQAYQQTTYRKSIHAVMSVLRKKESEQLELYLTKLRDEALSYQQGIKTISFQ